MIIPDKKKAVTTIIASLQPRSGEMHDIPSEQEQPEQHEEQEEMDQFVAVASEIREAFEQRDDHALAEALKSFFQMCESEPHEEGPHENEAEEPQE